MSNQFIVVSLREPRFCSRLDESAFFEWLKRIPGIKSIKGVSAGLTTEIDRSTFDDNSLRELIALHHRFNIDFDDIRPLVTAENEKWVFDEEKYWSSWLKKK